MTKNNANAVTEPSGAHAANSTELTVVAHANIGEAFLAIMNEVGYVQKLGKNTAQNYRYAGEADLIKALRPTLLKHGVLPPTPSEAKVELADVTVTSDNKKTFRVVVNYTYVFTHVPSGTNRVICAIGEGVDTGDKSSYKAATGALKYALRQAFLIETGDEPEANDISEEKKSPPNSPTNGEKTAREEFGSSVEFKKYYNETMSAIERLPNKESAAVIWTRIRRLENVDDQYAQNATDALQLKLDGLHLQG